MLSLQLFKAGYTQLVVDSVLLSTQNFISSSDSPDAFIKRKSSQKYQGFKSFEPEGKWKPTKKVVKKSPNFLLFF